MSVPIETAALSSSSDEELLSLTCAGSSEAFAVIFDRHGGPVFSVTYRVLRDPARAQDAAQETFVSAWRGRETYKASRASVRSWLLAIAHKRAVDEVRRESRHARRRAISDELLGDEPRHPDLTDEEAMRREDGALARAALTTLPAAQREAIELAYYGGLSQSEIADRLSLPLGTVKGRIRIGLAKLRSELARRDREGGTPASPLAA